MPFWFSSVGPTPSAFASDPGRFRLVGMPTVAFLLLATGCTDPVNSSSRGQNALLNLQCSIPRGEIFDGGVPVDGIPALNNPTFVEVGDPDIRYLDETTQFLDPRVVGIQVDGHPYAIPHNILWWHEVVNLDLADGTQLAVSYCPLTGSALVFDREGIGGVEMGVSGLIFRNNLILFDRNAQRSLFPQMMHSARCGPADGLRLEMFPAIDMRWSRWRNLHPDTRVVSGDTGIDRDYTRYPYGNYEQSRELLFPQDVPGPDEEIRPMKERILGIPSLGTPGAGGVAVPFGELELAEDQGVAAVYVESPQGKALVLWDGAARGAMAFRSRTEDDGPVELMAVDGRFLDRETGSEWTVDGRAVAGSLTGATLEAISDSYVAFWFAWKAFHPDTEIWTF